MRRGLRFGRGEQAQHADLIAAYFQEAGGFVDLEARNCSPPFPPGSDPLYVVMARKAPPAGLASGMAACESCSDAEVKRQLTGTPPSAASICSL